jgi:hypothetical protein
MVLQLFYKQIYAVNLASGFLTRRGGHDRIRNDSKLGNGRPEGFANQM